MPNSELKWWGLKGEWGKTEGTKEILIDTVRLFNSTDKENYEFSTNDDLVVKVEFSVKEKIKEPHFGIAIFREDGVYVYGPNTLLDGYSISSLNTGNGWFSIKYISIPLLGNNYRFSVAIWDKKEVMPYNYHSGLYKFRIKAENTNNQLFDTDYKCNDLHENNVVNHRDILSLGNLNSIWKKSIKYLNNVDINNVEFMDLNGNPRLSFSTNEPFKIRVTFSADITEEHNYLLWVGIFRQDGIYCHGVCKKIEKNERQFELLYPKLALLNGIYLASAGLFNMAGKNIIVFHHGVYSFKVSSALKDHGTVYCEHEWKWQLP
jgi:hypothetical protein